MNHETEKITQTKKLALSVQTLKRLSSAETDLVAGGGGRELNPTGGDTNICTGMCTGGGCNPPSVASECLCSGAATC